MSDSIRDRSAARNKAQKQFAVNERRASTFMEEQARERAERDAKNLRLRTLRLAKEEQDKQDAARLAEAAAAEKAKQGDAKPRKTRVKSRAG